MNKPYGCQFLRELLERIESGSRPSGGLLQGKDGIPSLGGENVTLDGRLFLDEVRRISYGFFSRMARGRLRPGDVLINKDGAQTGKVAIFEDEFPDAAINEHLFLLRGREDVIDQRYLFWSLHARGAQRQIARSITGSAQPGLSQTFVQKVRITVPEIAEQRRIAEIIDTLDETIRKTEQVIDKLERARNGLRNDLLTHGIDENGQLRDPERHPELFKESPLGRIPAEWDCSLLGDIAIHVGSGITPRGGRAVYVPEGVLFIRSQNVHFDGLRLDDDVAYISKMMHEAMKRSEVLPYDVLLNITGASIGRVCFFPGGIGPANVNQHVCVVRLPQTNESDSKFLAAALAAHIGQHQIHRLNAGGNRPGLNYQQLRTFLIPWPRKYERQTTARILSELERWIADERATLAKFRRLQHALMDDLLTGRIRVKGHEYPTA